MTRITLALAAGSLALAFSTPAAATDWSKWGNWWGGHTHYKGCGHVTSSSSSSSTSTSSSTTSSSTSGGMTSSSSGSTSSGGTPVPEPGMVGLFGLGLAGLMLRSRSRRRQTA